MKRDGLEGLIQKKTGLVIDAYFSGSKLRWILDHVPGARADAEKGKLAFGTVDSWLIWKLTGGKVHVTDPSNASRTMLYNIRTGEWDDELLKILKVPRSVLPRVAKSSEVYGEAENLGVPIAGIGGDQQAALFGQACHKPGMVKNTYGTGCFMLMNTGTDPVTSKNNLLTTVAWGVGDKLEYALEGSIFIAGAVVAMAAGRTRHHQAFGRCREAGRERARQRRRFPGARFRRVGRSPLGPICRGSISGLTRGSTAAHIARAALEGHRLPGGRCSFGHGSRFENQAEGTARGWRGLRE